MEYLENEVKSLLRRDRASVANEVEKVIAKLTISKFSRERILQAIEQTPEPKLKK